MSEGQRWLWRFYTAQVRMYYDTLRWLSEAGLSHDSDLPPAPHMMMFYWQRTGQYEKAQAHSPNALSPPRMPFPAQINKQPPPLPVKFFNE